MFTGKSKLVDIIAMIISGALLVGGEVGGQWRVPITLIPQAASLASAT
jgi:hypothetical protein